MCLIDFKNAEKTKWPAKAMCMQHGVTISHAKNITSKFTVSMDCRKGSGGPLWLGTVVADEYT